MPDRPVRWTSQRLAMTMGACAALTWFAHLSVSYALVPTACRSQTAVPLGLVTIVGVAVGVVTVVVASRARPDQDRADRDRAGDPAVGWRARLRTWFQLDGRGRSSPPSSRAASSGLAVAAYFTFVMLLAAFVPLLVGPCA